MKTDTGLIYNGKGWLPGIPARDLTAEEVKNYGGKEILIASGNYEEPIVVKPTKAPLLEKEN